jgi:hypothetical protein
MFCKRRDTDTVATREVLRCGPGTLRDKVTLTAALSVLVAAGRVTLVEDGLKRQVKVNPELLPMAVL